MPYLTDRELRDLKTDHEARGMEMLLDWFNSDGPTTENRDAYDFIAAHRAEPLIKSHGCTESFLAKVKRLCNEKAEFAVTVRLFAERADAHRAEPPADEPVTCAALALEKQRRIYHQSIVYDVCNLIDWKTGKKPGAGIVCGCSESPSKAVQETLKALLFPSEQDTAEQGEGPLNKTALTTQGGEQASTPAVPPPADSTETPDRRWIGEVEVVWDGCYHSLVGDDGGLVLMRDRGLGEALWSAAADENASYWKGRADSAEKERDAAIKDLAECYRQSGADPDGDEDWRIAKYAVQEVTRLRKGFNETESDCLAAEKREQALRERPDAHLLYDAMRTEVGEYMEKQMGVSAYVIEKSIDDHLLQPEVRKKLMESAALATHTDTEDDDG